MVHTVWVLVKNARSDRWLTAKFLRPPRRLGCIHFDFRRTTASRFLVGGGRSFSLTLRVQRGSPGKYYVFAQTSQWGLLIVTFPLQEGRMTGPRRPRGRCRFEPPGWAGRQGLTPGSVMPSMYWH